jgi:hypothetical protein
MEGGNLGELVLKVRLWGSNFLDWRKEEWISTNRTMQVKVKALGWMKWWVLGQYIGVMMRGHGLRSETRVGMYVDEEGCLRWGTRIEV